MLVVVVVVALVRVMVMMTMAVMVVVMRKGICRRSLAATPGGCRDDDREHAFWLTYFALNVM